MSGPDWIDLVLARAAELRAAGVLSIGPETATFAPVDPPPPEVGKIEPSDVVEQSGNPLLDPASYPGGFVPGFTIEKLEMED